LIPPKIEILTFIIIKEKLIEIDGVSTLISVLCSMPKPGVNTQYARVQTLPRSPDSLQLAPIPACSSCSYHPTRLSINSSRFLSSSLNTRCPSPFVYPAEASRFSHHNELHPQSFGPALWLLIMYKTCFLIISGIFI
jgi:hypothetical protein